jgi:hypothetical protein
MAKGKVKLPPDPLPPLPEPDTGAPGPYSQSSLRDVCGSRINPDAIGWYRRRELMTSKECGVKSCAHPDMETWLTQVRSFDSRMLVRQPPAAEWPLSKVIGQIPIWGEKLPFALPENQTLVVRYEDLVPNPITPPADARALNASERFQDGNHALILSFFGDRRYISGIWPQTDFWQQPFLDQFTAVIMPDFSHFCDDPIPQSLIGERMLQIFAEEGYYAGRTVIPSIAWRSEDSLRRQVELYKSLYPRVHTVLLDCYGSGVKTQLWMWRWLFAIEKYMTDTPIRWLIGGLSSARALMELRDILPNGNYHIITPLSMHRACMRVAQDKEVMATRFHAKSKAIEEYASGERNIDRLPRPDEWPSFSRVKLPPAPDQ